MDAARTGIYVRDVIVTDDVLTWTLDYGLRLRPISFAEAKEFIEEHHRHCGPPVGRQYGAAVSNGAEMVGVMTAGRPVSAELARQGCVEVNRVCVRATTPAALVTNACSMLYGYACREAFRRGHDRVVTYTLSTERGPPLRAAGFLPVARPKADRGIGRTGLGLTRLRLHPKCVGSVGETQPLCQSNAACLSRPNCCSWQSGDRSAKQTGDLLHPHNVSQQLCGRHL